MAALLPLSYEQYKIGGMRLIYTVSKGIGAGQTNEPSDVAMIQFMLNKTLKGLPELKTDGVCGAKTIARIREFQSQMKAKKFDLAIDGRIGPITSRDWFYDQGNESYTRTMMVLNLRYRSLNQASYDNKDPFHFSQRWLFLLKGDGAALRMLHLTGGR